MSNMKIIILKSIHIDFNLFKSENPLHLYIGNNTKVMAIPLPNVRLVTLLTNIHMKLNLWICFLLYECIIYYSTN